MRDDRRSRFEERRNRWEQRMENRSGHSHIWTGLFILLIGVAALLKTSFANIPGWIFSWQTFLIALGLFIGFKHGFRGMAWLILILIGSVFLLRDFYPNLAIRNYIWPSILILVGALMVLRPRRSHWQCEGSKKKTGPAGIDDTKDTGEPYTSKEDFVDCTSIFSGTKKNIISKNFRGGDIVSIFGGTELDLTQADMQAPATLEITTIFGGTKLLIPGNWDIKSEVVNVFGGIEDKRKMHTITEPTEKILLLKGTVLFGGIEIKSY